MGGGTTMYTSMFYLLSDLLSAYYIKLLVSQGNMSFEKVRSIFACSSFNCTESRREGQLSSLINQSVQPFDQIW